MKSDIIFLVGPTASGKSELAYKLAKKISGEIISLDSMQIYKGMNIVAAYPKKEYLKKVKHHLIGQISPTKEFSVAEYRKKALALIEKILKKNKTPIFVGGTGLYMTIMLDGIFEGVKENPEIRARLYKEAEKFGSQKLYDKLAKLDPEAAEKIHPNDLRRIVRALEVCLSQDKKFSELKEKRSGIWGKYDIKIFGLNLNREELYNKINKRVNKMIKQGLVKEVKKLLKLKLSKTAQFAIGIREIKDYLDGKITLEQAKEEMAKNTRRYAKRQMTWFNKDKRIEWSASYL
ncbi:MAG: tRNA (adenosine(37)-N6)-dimethylallyltransferase MiaA [Candidatus Omnitrophota bacterium]